MYVYVYIYMYLWTYAYIYMPRDHPLASTILFENRPVQFRRNFDRAKIEIRARKRRTRDVPTDKETKLA